MSCLLDVNCSKNDDKLLKYSQFDANCESETHLRRGGNKKLSGEDGGEN